MSELQDRVSVFLVPPGNEAEIQEAERRISSLEFCDDGSYWPPEWYVARHDLFERLLVVAKAHRILPPDALADLVDFVTALHTRHRITWQDLSPSTRRELAAQRLSKFKNSELRGAVTEVLSSWTGGDDGLWIVTEDVQPAKPEPEPAQASETSEKISPEELTRRLIEYVAKADRAEAERERLQGPSRYAWLCELTDEAARGPATRMRAAALSPVKDEDGELADALESFCQHAPVESIADCVYSAEQARELLAWLKKERRSATRDLMLRVLRSAVTHKHAFAIVFVPAMK